MKPTLVLGIETSCDECSASVVEYTPSDLVVRSVATFSQIQLHEPYGGVVPEIASRNHLESVNPMIERALREAKVAPADLAAVAVTNRPGLVGALLVGVSAAKALAYALRKPLVPVHHLEGHAVSLFLRSADGSSARAPLDRNAVPYPMCLAVVSGGHTNLHVVPTPPELWPTDFLARSLVGRSRDDAAGEAFDKTAKLLGFPYPGGKYVDEAARGGNPRAFDLPRALPQKATLDFSFSGLKTAVALEVEKLKRADGVAKGAADAPTPALDAAIPDLCASIQEAIVDALLAKIELVVRGNGCRSLAIVGGVAANSRMRARLAEGWKRMGLEVAPLFPEPQYCTDNAAMIAGAGAFRFRQNRFLTGDPLMTLNAVAYPDG